MPSNSLKHWQSVRCRALDEIENAHATVGGTARGRRYATQQINYAYAALLSSHFQGFCRDLHSECIDHIVAITPSSVQALLRIELVWNRALDKGNPQPSAIGSDFNRLGIQFWPSVLAQDNRNGRRQKRLKQMVDWRNAITHQDFGPVGGDPTLHLARVRLWRRAVTVLANQFDQAMHDYMGSLLGSAPW